MWMIALSFLICHLSFVVSACSKEETEAGEWDDWQQRNEVVLASLVDSVKSHPAQWQRILSYAKSPQTEHDAHQYVYVKTVEQGSGTECPAFTDSVRIVYQGRLIPSATYSQGFVFDGSVYGQFSVSTSSTAKMLVSNTVVGFSTALQHMHRGDRWLIYIPYELGYGETGQSDANIPGYSLLVFDVKLIDFSHVGQAMPAWSSRQRR